MDGQPMGHFPKNNKCVVFMFLFGIYLRVMALQNPLEPMSASHFAKPGSASIMVWIFSQETVLYVSEETNSKPDM
jgi:hypothetical protein